MLELVGLSEVAGRRAGGFSLGMAQRLGIAAALLGDPPVLMFDEPVNGLDPDGIRWIRGFLKGLAAEGRTVLVSSHLMSELEGTADDLVVIGRGRLIAETSVSELLGRMSDSRVDLRTPRASAVMNVLARAGAVVTSTGPDSLAVAGLDVAHIAELALDHSLPLYELSPHRASLEEAFMELTRDEQDYIAGLTRCRGGGRGRRGARLQAGGDPSSSASRVDQAEDRSQHGVDAPDPRRHLAAVHDPDLLGIDDDRREPGPPGRQRHRVRQPFRDLVRGDRRRLFAVLAITSEYSSRMIRTSFAADPRRGTLLAAKASIMVSIVFVAGLATSVASFLIGQRLLRGGGFVYENGYPAVSLLDGQAFRAVVGGAVYLALLAVFSLSVGAILRHTAGAITLVLAVLLAPVIATNFLPEHLGHRVEQSSLLGGGLAVQQTVERGDSIKLDPWAGLAVGGVYAAASFLVALVLIRRRDA